MALEIKQSVRLAQQLVVTPQLQQAIKLLQLSRFELETLIQKELLENPALEDGVEEDETDGEAREAGKKEEHVTEHANAEVGNKDGELKEPENFDWENYLANTYNSPGYAGEREVQSDEPSTYENVLRQTESLQDHLLWQLHLGTFTETEKQIGTEIIGNITDDGYLTSTPEEIAEKTSFPRSEVEALLRRLQEFDPLGVGARDLKECLVLQAKQYPEDFSDLCRLIQDHLPDLERHDEPAIAKKTGLAADRVKTLARMVAHMEPKPGRPYSGELPQYITPDVFVYKMGQEYLVTLNEDGLPKLRIGQFYRRSLMKGSEVAGQTKEYIQERLRAAMWLIKSIHQRQRTLLRVSKSIVKFQRDFFDQGLGSLRPLVLKDVAEDIEMHESTISRVTTNKFMHTPRGIFELKFFFNSGIHQLEGGGVASEAVKMQIKKLLEGEDPAKPLSDQAIMEHLRSHNIDIARRTVAKYREVMLIAPSSKRRRRS
ncbi:MAG: RNA polymerase factor sigma-54 [Deltaproteobacteria bacterium]|nr:RNA polymerase factor sigma-54 [Deltaproteobacteria bacterium]